MHHDSFTHLALTATALLLTLSACDEATEDAPLQAGRYAIGTSVYGPENTSAYLKFADTLDFGGDELSLDDAREFPGSSDFAVWDGDVFVASGDAPKITRYAVGDGGALEPVGEIDFAAQGLGSAAFWNNQFVSATKAYMLNGAAELVVWNPETMRIEGTIEIPAGEDRPGLDFVAGLADRASVVHGGRFYLSMYWTDASYADRADDSVIQIIDTATDTLADTIPAACPGLDYATADDDGTLHFSNWTGGVGTHYVLGTAQNCVASLDPATNDVTTKTFADITGGHEGAAFRYAGGGRFLLSVFDEVKADAANADDAFAIVGEPNFQLWSYDPATGDAGPVEGVDWNSGAVIHADLGGQLYSMVPGEGYDHTVVYRLDGPSTASAVFGITGWSFRLFSVE